MTADGRNSWEHHTAE